MYTKLLNKQEEKVMELFWRSRSALTSKDVLSQFSDTEWSAPYTYSVLRTLEKKGLICEYGRIRYKTQYMREYVAALSKEEFYIRLAYANHVNPVEFISQAILFSIHEMPRERESILQTISAIIVKINTTKIR